MGGKFGGNYPCVLQADVKGAGPIFRPCCLSPFGRHRKETVWRP